MHGLRGHAHHGEQQINALRVKHARRVRRAVQRAPFRCITQVRKSEFDHDLACEETTLTQRRSHVIATPAKHGTHLSHVLRVSFEGTFRTNRFFRRVGHDGPIVQASGRLIQAVCGKCRSGGLFQRFETHACKVGDRVDAPRVQTLFQRRSDAGNATQWHHLHELCMPRHGNHQHAVGLGIGGCHFGDQLVRRDADGTGDVIAQGHLFTYPRPNGTGTAPLQQRSGNVHIAFVNRYLFDTAGNPAEHFLENAMRHRAIVAHVDRKENAVRA